MINQIAKQRTVIWVHVMFLTVCKWCSFFPEFRSYLAISCFNLFSVYALIMYQFIPQKIFNQIYIFRQIWKKQIFMTCAYLINTATTNKVTTIPNDENITGIIPQMLVNSRCWTGSSSQAVLLESGREPFGHWKQVNSSTKICSYKT